MTRIHLDCCTGPPCPNCGCRDGQILREPTPDTPDHKTWFGSGMCRCVHCGREFHFREVAAESEPLVEVAAESEPEPPVATKPIDPPRVLPVVRCEGCGEIMKVSKTLKAIRRYKCPGCGKTAKRVR